MRCRAAERRGKMAAAALLGILVVAVVPTGAAQLQERSDDGTRVPSRVILAEDVFDPIFGFFIAVLDHDQFGTVDAAFLDSLASAEGGSKVPYQSISTMTREEIGGADALVRIDLDGEFEEPIPFSILGYRPGSIRATQRMDMVHWHLGDRSFIVDAEKKGEQPRTVTVLDSHLFVFCEGSMEMDIDAWLDRLLGSRLDDVELTGFFVFRDEGVRIGLGFGYNPKGSGRTGAFDFSANESIFPASKAYLSMGRQVRALAERRLERWRRNQPGSALSPAAPN